MSTAVISTTTGFEYHRVASARRVPTVVATARPNYAARRVGAVAIVVLAALVLVVLFQSVLASFSGQPAQAAEALPAVAAASADEIAPPAHVAQPGDTLWSIADEYRGDVGRDQYVDALVRLNGGTVVVVGQAVALP